MNTDTLRQKFLSFFAKKGHKIIASSSLIPQDDPTLLFTTAGMSQFKKEFLGAVTTFRRATSAQRCLRTDDLDKVGLTASHHTFFEMLGNFSFGDYFKDEAITWAWEFLTQDLKINPHNLWVSVYADDPEAYAIWKNKVGFSENKIVKLGAKDNFWPANAIEDGPNGPCGACSEIFFDYGKDTGCLKPECRPGCNCGRFVEIWNLVFTQFNRKDKGVLEPLPSKNIDTGMGLERMASVLQGVKTNFEIDIFKPLIDAIKCYPLSAVRSPLIHSIADHIRAITFALYDGVMPSNEQRGYVVRKLIRKAEFCGYTLGIREPFLYTLAAVVADTFTGSYPELKKSIPKISESIRIEEKNFIATLKDAPVILAREFKESKRIGTGHSAFTLHDTYGIPLEITKSWAKNEGFEINEAEFTQDLKEQQERSKKSSKLNQGVFVGDALDLRQVKESKFLGYARSRVKEAKIIKILKDTKSIKAAQTQESCQIILDKTPFYAESGGQIGDKGKIIKGKNIFQVEDTQKHGKIFLHIGKIESGKFKVGDEVDACVDSDFRQAVARAHTATHLLQAALREVLGEHIKQAGSLVEADRLRFDFVHFEKIAKEDLKKIEAIVQKNILADYEVSSQETTLAKAKKDKALAFFEEKYEDKVRLVQIKDVSKELCGGTHSERSSALAVFAIASEGSIAKGVRRIEALTGELACKHLRQSQEQLAKISGLLKSSDEEIVPLIEEKLNRLAALEKDTARLRLEVYTSCVDTLIAKADTAFGVSLIVHKYTDVEIGLLRQIMDLVKSKVSSYAICLGSSEALKASLVVGFSDDLVKKGADASKVIKEIAVLIKGSGGGRTSLAQAGGVNPQGLDEALEKFKGLLRSQILQ